VVTFFPGFSVPKQTVRRVAPSSLAVASEPADSRKDVRFKVDGISIRAWLYLPEQVSQLGGTKDAGLAPYAARFQKAGFAVLVFDYRYFGESDGEPRQLIWIPDQLEDWAAAIRYARSLMEIDPSRIALWGTSFSGGHVLVIASKDNEVACVSAQCPGLDGHAAGEMWFERVGIGYALRMLVHGQRDMFRSWLGLSPHRIPLVGKPGSVALMTTPDAYESFGKLAPAHFVNEACARINLRGGKYRPVQYAKDVSCPVLLQICDQDTLIPMSAAEETRKILGKKAQVIHYPIGHFDIYLGDNFEKGVSDQIEFFKKNL